MTEIWKDIPCFEGRYQASNLGRVRSLDRVGPYDRHGKKQTRTLRGRILLPRFNGRYLTVSLSGKTRLLHQLILLAFKGLPPSPNAEGRHLNGQSRDNRADNLKWGTASENQNDRFAHGTACKGEENYRAILTEAQVREMMRLRKKHGPTKIAEIVGCERHLVKHVLYGQSWNWLTGLPRNRHPAPSLRT